MNRLKISVPVVLLYFIAVICCAGICPGTGRRPMHLSSVRDGCVRGFLTGLVTVRLADGAQCTVVLAQGTYNHPVTALLGRYFDDVSAGGPCRCACRAAGVCVECPEDGAGPGFPARLPVRCRLL